MNTKVWKLLKRVNKNWYHEKCNHYYQNERCPIMARVNTKTINTVRHVYLTEMNGLNRDERKETPCHFVILSIKITSHVVHFRSEKQKSSVYFAARGIALLWLFFHLYYSVSSFVHL